MITTLARIATTFCLLALCSTLCPSLSAAEDGPEPVVFEIGEMGGWCMGDDGTTLIVTSPSTGEVVFWDSLKFKKLRSVEVDFAPNRIALQGDKLFVSVRGSSLLYALNAETCEVITRFKLPGEPFEALACHRKRGLLYAANMNEEVYVIDPESGKFSKTKARGTMLAMDPTEGKFLLTGTNRPGSEFLEVETNGRVSRVRLVMHQGRAIVFKHAIKKDELRLVSANTNAAFGAGGSLAINHNATRFAMAAGGGWRSLTDMRFHYVVAVFESEDMETMVGQVDLGAYPQTVAFHPVLNLGAALRHGGVEAEIKLFKASSLTDRGTIKLPRVHPAPLKAHRLMFAGGGATLVHYYRKKLSFVPLELSDKERAQLSQR